MTTTAAFNSGMFSSFLLFLSAGTLILGGALLLSRGTHIRREKIEARTNLMLPDAPASRVPPANSERASESSNLNNPFDQEVARAMSDFLGAAPRNARLLFLALRIGLAGLLFAAIAIESAALIHRLPLRGAASLVAGISGYFIPVMLISHRRTKRIENVVRGFPEALELLVVCAEAGISLEDAIRRVSVEMRSSQPQVAEELALTAADLKILPSRDQALLKLAERVDQKNIRNVVTTLNQTMRLGTPLAQALRAVASEMRDDALFELEERANRLPAILTIPMMLFILPTIFLVIGGPAALRLMDIFRH